MTPLEAESCMVNPPQSVTIRISHTLFTSSPLKIIYLISNSVLSVCVCRHVCVYVCVCVSIQHDPIKQDAGADFLQKRFMNTKRAGGQSHCSLSSLCCEHVCSGMILCHVAQ